MPAGTGAYRDSGSKAAKKRIALRNKLIVGSGRRAVDSLVMNTAGARKDFQTRADADYNNNARMIANKIEREHLRPAQDYMRERGRSPKSQWGD